MYKNILKDHPHRKMSEVNFLTSQTWKELNEEQKQFYRDQAIEQFEKRNAQYDDRISI